jgi:hypothetical protein
MADPEAGRAVSHFAHSSSTSAVHRNEAKPSVSELRIFRARLLSPSVVSNSSTSNRKLPSDRAEETFLEPEDRTTGHIVSSSVHSCWKSATQLKRLSRLSRITACRSSVA